MQDLQEKHPVAPKPTRITATIAAVLNDHQVVINRGAEDGITFGQRFTVYELSDQDILDPISSQPLGRLETIKGTGRVVHIQDKLSILEATHENLILATLIEPAKIKFKAPKVGDRARPI